MNVFDEIVILLKKQLETSNKILAALSLSVSGIQVTPGIPSDRSEENQAMAMTVKLKKGNAAQAVPTKKVSKSAPAVSFTILDTQDDSFTVQGVDASGAAIDITAVATMTVTSDTPAVFSVDPPTGMSVKGHGLTPGTANLTFVVTWGDGSVGPFTFILPLVVTGSTATGIIVTPGTPTIR